MAGQKLSHKISYAPVPQTCKYYLKWQKNKERKKKGGRERGKKEQRKEGRERGREERVKERGGKLAAYSLEKIPAT